MRAILADEIATLERALGTRKRPRRAARLTRKAIEDRERQRRGQGRG